MITSRPSCRGGLEAIDRLVATGVTAAVGHTDGDAEMIKEAVDRGATVATHLFNAMRPIHHREPGPVPGLLDDPRVVVELIADGVHLHDDVLLMAIAAAGPDRVALITDAMLAAGASDGRYRLGSLPVDVSDGRARVVEADGSAGVDRGLDADHGRRVRTAGRARAAARAGGADGGDHSGPGAPAGSGRDDRGRSARRPLCRR